MQRLPAISSACWAIWAGVWSVWFARARAAAVAYEPPEPMPRMPSVGWMTSPCPETRRVVDLSAMIMSASNLRRARSVRQSFASSMAAFLMLAGDDLRCSSKRSMRANASAAEPAKPTRTPALSAPPWSILRTLTASALETMSPSVTWPSPAIATFWPLRIQMIVVAWNGFMEGMILFLRGFVCVGERVFGANSIILEMGFGGKLWACFESFWLVLRRFEVV